MVTVAAIPLKVSSLSVNNTMQENQCLSQVFHSKCCLLEAKIIFPSLYLPLNTHNCDKVLFLMLDIKSSKIGYVYKCI